MISPNFTYLPTVIESEDIHVWANIGVVFLMFALGLEFSFKKLATVGGSAFITAMTVMGSMILIGGGIGSLLGWEKMDCIFLGGMLSMSSTMIILKAYEEYRLKQEKFAQLVLGTLVIEDIAGIFMMIILSVVFSNLFKFDVEYFPVYLLSGQLIFNFYSEATTASMSAIMDNGPLLKKIYVPKYLFVLSRVFSSTINLLASFTALILVMLAMRVELHYTVLLVPIPLIFIVLFSLGVGLIL